MAAPDPVICNFLNGSFRHNAVNLCKIRAGSADFQCHNMKSFPFYVIMLSLDGFSKCEIISFSSDTVLRKTKKKFLDAHKVRIMDLSTTHTRGKWAKMTKYCCLANSDNTHRHQWPVLKYLSVSDDIDKNVKFPSRSHVSELFKTFWWVFLCFHAYICWTAWSPPGEARLMLWKPLLLVLL